jgi:hypothetical protein
MEFGGSISQRISRESKGRAWGPSMELEKLVWMLVRVNVRDRHWGGRRRGINTLRFPTDC